MDVNTLTNMVFALRSIFVALVVCLVFFLFFSLFRR